VGFVDWCWIFGVLSVALFLPFSIAGVGVRDLTLVGLLGLMSVPPDKAMALSFYLLAVNIFIAGIGGVCEIGRMSQCATELDSKN
jgi:hypothetical protein